MSVVEPAEKVVPTDVEPVTERFEPKLPELSALIFPVVVINPVFVIPFCVEVPETRRVVPNVPAPVIERLPEPFM